MLTTRKSCGCARGKMSFIGKDAEGRRVVVCAMSHEEAQTKIDKGDYIYESEWNHRCAYGSP